jgi:hypothetical protein
LKSSSSSESQNEFIYIHMYKFHEHVHAPLSYFNNAIRSQVYDFWIYNQGDQIGRIFA